MLVAALAHGAATRIAATEEKAALSAAQDVVASAGHRPSAKDQ